MKKIWIFLCCVLAASMFFVLAACNDEKPAPDDGDGFVSDLEQRNDCWYFDWALMTADSYEHFYESSRFGVRYAKNHNDGFTHYYDANGVSLQANETTYLMFAYNYIGASDPQKFDFSTYLKFTLIDEGGTVYYDSQAVSVQKLYHADSAYRDELALNMQADPEGRLVFTNVASSSPSDYYMGDVFFIKLEVNHAGTLHVDFNISCKDCENAFVKTTDSYTVGLVLDSASEVTVHNVAVKYLTQSAYNYGQFDDGSLTDLPNVDEGIVYMVADFDFHANSDNDGVSKINSIIGVYSSNLIQATIEEVATSDISENADEAIDVTRLSARFKVLPKAGEDKHVRVVVCLKMLVEAVSNAGEITIDLLFVGNDMSVVGEKYNNLSVPFGEQQIEYMWYDGVYYVKDVKDKSATKIAIPETYRGVAVTEIWLNAFADCKQLQSVAIPDGLSYIGNYAFLNCTSLVGIDIPEGATLGYAVFSGCNSLRELTLPNIDKALGIFFGEEQYDGGVATEQMTYGISSGRLVTYYIPSSLKSVTVRSGAIASYSFQNCGNIENVTLGEHVTSIGYRAFRNCNALKRITVSTGVNRIFEYAFQDCWNIEQLVYNGTTEGWLAIDKTPGDPYSSGIWSSECCSFEIVCTNGKLDVNGNAVD